MLPCKEIVRILSSHEDLSWVRRAELRMHLMMCKHCARYWTQLKMIKDGFSKLFTKITQVDQTEVNQLEEQILDNFKKKVSK